jgi:hypothetical protein
MMVPLLEFDWASFVMCRATLYSKNNTRSINGWMVGARGSTVRIRTPDVSIENDTEFLLHVFGPTQDAFCRATSVSQWSTPEKLTGAAARDLTLGIQSPIRVAKATRLARRLVEGVVATITMSRGESFEAFVEDVSATGAGLFSSEQVSAGSTVEMRIDAGCGRATLNCSVVYATAINVDETSHWRIGLTVEPVDRLSKANWKKLVEP